MKRFLIAFMLVMGLLTGAHLSFGQNPQEVLQQIKPQYSPNQVLVKFQPNTSADSKIQILKSIKGQIKGTINYIDIDIVQIPAQKVQESITRLEKDSHILYAEPNYAADALQTPLLTPKQWNLDNIKTTSQTGNPYVVIGVLDTGIDPNHPDLSEKVNNWVDCRTIESQCAVKDTDESYTQYQDLNGHGTSVAGVIAANADDNSGISGVGDGIHLMSIKVLDDNGVGYYSSILKGMMWAVDRGHRAKVINMSFGSTFPSQALSDAINFAWSKEIVLIGAAGNNNTDQLVYPAAYDNVIAVAATNGADQKASFSSFGTWVDVAAPGNNIYTTYPTYQYKLGKQTNYDYASGTSLAAAHVSGMAGLIISHQPTLTNEEIRAQIESTADRIQGTGTLWNYGKINVLKAIR